MISFVFGKCESFAIAISDSRFIKFYQSHSRLMDANDFRLCLNTWIFLTLHFTFAFFYNSHSSKMSEFVLQIVL